MTIQTYDDQGVAAKAVAGMQRLKDKYDVPVIIQNVSGSIMAMLERNEKMGILMIGFFKHSRCHPRRATSWSSVINRPSIKTAKDLARETAKTFKGQDLCHDLRHG